MPASVEDLFVEIDRVHVHALAPWCPSHRCPRTSHAVRSERRLVRLQQDVVVSLNIIYPEVIMVRPCHHLGAVSTKRALKLVEDAVVLVQVAQLAT